STDGAAGMVAAEFPQVTLIRNGENRGFAAASNQAAAVARGRFLFFLNNDTEVAPHTLGRLLAHASANPAAGMFGPRLREPGGAGRRPLFWYKRAVPLDAPVQLVGKMVEAAARRVVGHKQGAARSWAAARGVWAFLRSELVRFWRA